MRLSNVLRLCARGHATANHVRHLRILPSARRHRITPASSTITTTSSIGPVVSLQLHTTRPLSAVRRRRQRQRAILTTVTSTIDIGTASERTNNTTTSSTQPRHLPAAAASRAETRHDVVVSGGASSRAGSTVDAAAEDAPPRARGGGGAAEAGYGERVVVRVRRGGFGAAGPEYGRCVAGALARPEAGRVVVRGGDEEEQVQGREYVDDRLEVVVGVGDIAEVSTRDNWSFWLYCRSGEKQWKGGRGRHVQPFTSEASVKNDDPHFH